MKYILIRQKREKLSSRKRKFSLKELRARKNETQLETAQGLGVAPQTYCAWEKKGISHVPVSTAYKIATYFGVTLDELELN